MSQADDVPPGRPQKMAELASVEFREILKLADVVIGKDERTGNEFLVFRRPLCRDVIAAGEGTTAAMTVVPILQNTTELEALLDAVEVAKGRHDYESPWDVGGN